MLTGSSNSSASMTNSSNAEAAPVVQKENDRLKQELGQLQTSGQSQTAQYRAVEAPSRNIESCREVVWNDAEKKAFEKRIKPIR